MIGLPTALHSDIPFCPTCSAMYFNIPLINAGTLSSSGNVANRRVRLLTVYGRSEPEVKLGEGLGSLPLFFLCVNVGLRPLLSRGLISMSEMSYRN